MSNIKNGECDFHYYPTSVMHSPSKNNNLVFVEYQHTLFEPSSMEKKTQRLKKRLREYINVRNEVDDFVTVDQCSLHLHRNWTSRDCVPPLLQPQQQPQEKPLEIKKKPKFKIKYTGKSKNESNFERGEIIEVSSDQEGYKGVWFVATIVHIIEKERFLVEYRDLLMNDDDTQHLKEEVDAKYIRPCPPQVSIYGSFKKLQEVDAWYNDAWCEGMVVELVNKTEYFVQFMNNEVLKFESSKLRSRQNWIDGKWVMCSKESSELVKKFGDVIHKSKNLVGTKSILKYPIPSEKTNTIARNKFDLYFYKGANIEVRSDEKGYEGSWYTATVVDLLPNEKFLVEYLTLKTDDLTKQLKDVVHVSDIRPYPPHPPNIDFVRPFVTHEKVDVWYNDGWWEGEVSSVGHGLNGFEYKVYFCTSNEELEFQHDYLRPHQEWVDGEWVLASLG